MFLSEKKSYWKKPLFYWPKQIIERKQALYEYRRDQGMNIEQYGTN